MVWTYGYKLWGMPQHYIRVELQEDQGQLLWVEAPEDESFQMLGVKSSCQQSLADFRAFGPPDPAFRSVPEDVLDAICAATGTADAEWRKPLPENVAAFFHAAESGDIEGMREWMRTGVTVHTRDRQHRTVMWYALEAFSTEPTQWLMDLKPDLNAQDRHGRTILMEAAAKDKHLLADLYKLHGADLKMRDHTGKTAWLIATESGARWDVLFTVKACVAEDWARALHVAARRSNTVWMEDMDWYVEHSKPVMNPREGKLRRTPLQSCLYGEQPHPLFRGWQPQPAAVRWLVEHGADLTVVDEEEGMTILHHAAKRNLPWLVSAGIRAGVDLNARDNAGKTAIEYAKATDNNVRLIKALLDVKEAPASRRPEHLKRLHRDWKWKARDRHSRHDEFKVVLRGGVLTWSAHGTRHEQDADRFRIEGPPRDSDLARTITQEVVDDLCAFIGDEARLWEVPLSKQEREVRVKEWEDSQPAPEAEASAPVPPPPPRHQSGKWCYARMDIEDHFTAPSGAGGDGEWSCWMEFPEEWCACEEKHLEQWLTQALQRAYGLMNEKASGPDGGHYSLNRCWAAVLSRAEAIKQPWAEQGKVLYQVADGETAPVSVPDEERRRPLTKMGDPGVEDNTSEA
jgi:hypothetical protein